jgi:hypothetical protein
MAVTNVTGGGTQVRVPLPTAAQVAQFQAQQNAAGNRALAAGKITGRPVTTTPQFTGNTYGTVPNTVNTSKPAPKPAAKPAAAKPAAPTKPAPKPAAAKPQAKTTVTIKHNVTGHPNVTVAHTHPAAQPKAPQQPVSLAQRAANMGVVNPAYNYSSAQLLQIARQITAGQTNAVVNPLRQQAADIGAQGRAATGLYQAGLAKGQNILAGLAADQAAGQGQLAGAQTQQAQDVANMISGAGNTATQLYGGTLSPQAQAAQQAIAGAAGATAGARTAFTNTAAQNQANYLRDLRGNAAAVAGPAGAAQLGTAYARLSAPVQQAIQTALSKQGPAAKQLAQTLGQQQFANQILRKEYGLKAYTAQTQRKVATYNYLLGQGKEQIAAANSQTAAFNAQTQRAYDQAKTKNDVANTQLKTYLGNQNIAIRNAQLAINQANADTAAGRLTETQRHNRVTEQQAIIKQARKNATNPTSLKGIGNIYTAMGVYRSNTQIPHAYTNAAGQSVTGKVPAVQARVMLHGDRRFSGPEAEAAYEMVTYGYISPTTERQLRQSGVNPPYSMLTKRPTSGAVSAAGRNTGGVSGRAQVPKSDITAPKK